MKFEFREIIDVRERADHYSVAYILLRESRLVYTTGQKLIHEVDYLILSKIMLYTTSNVIQGMTGRYEFINSTSYIVNHFILNARS